MKGGFLLIFPALLVSTGALHAPAGKAMPSVAIGDAQPETETKGNTALESWPQWRGPLGTGVAPHADPPVTWSESRNLRWTLALPGMGHSTPVVWGRRLFVTSAEPYGEKLAPVHSDVPGVHDQAPVVNRHRFMALAVERRSGSILWRRVLREEVPHAGGHVTSSLASASPVTDGELLFAFFGSYGLYCLDLEGNVQWKADLGRMHTLHAHGEGSSPALHGDRLIVNWDHEGESFVFALDRRTGKQLWKTRRESGSSWSTPVVVEAGGRMQVIISGSGRVGGYDAETGTALWECGGLSVENVVATPVVGGGLLYAGSSYDRSVVMAIPLGGDVNGVPGRKQPVWERRSDAPYVPSLLVYGDALYYLRHFQGTLTRVDARTGEDRPGAVRLRGLRTVFSSPIGAAGRVYVVGRSGVTVVLRHDDALKTLAVNSLDDSFSASPLAVGGNLYLRGEKHLYCIGRD